MIDRLFFAEPITRLEDIIPYLAKQERHWKKGYSAYELAYSWVGAKGIPDPVEAVLHQAEEFRGMELIEGFFEKETDLRSRGRPSQTDLLALIGDGEGFAVLGVEGQGGRALRAARLGVAHRRVGEQAGATVGSSRDIGACGPQCLEPAIPASTPHGSGDIRSAALQGASGGDARALVLRRS